jgi:hypothetical protein
MLRASFICSAWEVMVEGTLTLLGWCLLVNTLIAYTATHSVRAVTFYALCDAVVCSLGCVAWAQPLTQLQQPWFWKVAGVSHATLLRGRLRGHMQLCISSAWREGLLCSALHCFQGERQQSIVCMQGACATCSWTSWLGCCCSSLCIATSHTVDNGTMRVAV